MRIQQAVNYVMAGCIGYFISYVTIQLPSADNCILQEDQHEKSCPKCPTCDASTLDSNKDLDARVLNKRFQPKSMYEVIQYEYFNARHLYNSFYGEPKHGLLRHEKEDIRDISMQIMVEFNNNVKKNDGLNFIKDNNHENSVWKVKRLLNGYRRVDPMRGIEYVIDAELVSIKRETRKVHFEIVKPYKNGITIKKQTILENTPNTKIYFILPISNVGDRFKKFILWYEDICLRSQDENIALIIVLFTKDTESEYKNRLVVKNRVKELKLKYKASEMRLIESKGDFSRAYGLHLGIESLSQDSLLYFCDVDVMFNKDFLERCRLNTVKHEQVYYPIVFAQYDPKIVKEYSPPNRYKTLLDITKYTGHWVHYAYGMVCMYKSDYTAVGGFDVNRQGWGGEDVELFTKHAKSQINVFRAMDPGLIHLFHPKYCDKGLSAEQYEMCIQSAGESLGSRQQLGKLLISKPQQFNYTL